MTLSEELNIKMEFNLLGYFLTNILDSGKIEQDWDLSVVFKFWSNFKKQSCLFMVHRYFKYTNTEMQP